MTTDPAPSAESIPKPEKKRRSPVERVIVWGGIALLAVIVLVEFRAQRGYNTSLAALEETFERDDAVVHLSELREMMALAPAESGPTQQGNQDVYTFNWFSLFKSGQYTLTVNTERAEDNPEVLSFATRDAPEPERVAVPVAEGGGNGGNESTGVPDPAAMAPGNDPNGGPTPEVATHPLLETIDTDGDGEVSADELEAAPEALLNLDADGDGQLTGDEFRPANVADFFGGEGGDAGPPQRPPLEGDGQPEESAESPAPADAQAPANQAADAAGN